MTTREVKKSTIRYGNTQKLIFVRLTNVKLDKNRQGGGGGGEIQDILCQGV